MQNLITEKKIANCKSDKELTQNIQRTPTIQQEDKRCKLKVGRAKDLNRYLNKEDI